MTEYTQEDLDEHLKKEHGQSPFSTYLREIVYGGNDGIVTTFAVVAGFTGASSGNIASFSFMAVLLFGMANLFADASSMGLGSFLSVRSDQGVYRKSKKIEKGHLRDDVENEKLETKFMLKKRGFSDEEAGKLTEIYSTNEDYWIEFMMNHELEMKNPEDEKPVLTGLATFFSFIFFGVIPLIPYLLSPEDVQKAFIASCIATFFALFLLGLLRWIVTKEKFFKAVFEVLLLGGVSALVAFSVGLVFRGM